MLASIWLGGIAMLAPDAVRAQQGPFVYVPNFFDNNVSVIDTPTNAVTGSAIPVGSFPAAAAVRGDGSLVYTQHWMSTDRVAFAGDRLQAQFNAESFGGRAEAGYRIPNALAAITPYAAVQAQNFHTPTYSETDITGGGTGLTYASRNATDTRSELGARFDRLILLNWNAVLALRARIAWAHDWISDPNLLPSFEALPGASFLVQGATPAKNNALASAGAELRLINGVSLLGKFDGEFAAHSQTYAGTGTVRYVW